MSCDDIIRMHKELEQEKRERGYECIYYENGSAKCDYILPKQ